MTHSAHDPIKIVKLLSLGGPCPTQWEAWDDQGREYYMRYRWGHLTFCRWDVSPPEYYLSEQIGDQYDGMLDDDTMKQRLIGIVDWSECKQVDNRPVDPY